MAGVFDTQGFGVLSEYNGSLVTNAANSAMQQIAATNANSIELAPRIFTETGTSNEVVAPPDKTESDANIATAIDNARALGLSVLLKPMLTGLDGTGQNKISPTDPAAFFAAYTEQMVHFAGIAEQSGAEGFSIGNEMSAITGPQYEAYWTDLIAAVRAVYHGEITYSAATDEAHNVSFWDQVDVIGVNAYPPLTSELDPSVDEMKAAWENVPKDNYWAAAMEWKSPVDFFHSLAEEHGKQVLFTEVGYRSLEGTNIRPGSWTGTGEVDVQEQHDAFNAFFQVMGSEGGDWFRGAQIWQWDANNLYSSTGYSPMGKPAQQLITEWFGGEHQPPALDRDGTPVADVIDVGGGADSLSGGLGDDIIKGGGGNDTIIGGPDTLAPLDTTVVTVTGYGSVVDGVGAQMQLRVNGQPIGDPVEFHTAADPSDYQSYTFSFRNPDEVTSLDVGFINDGTGTGGDRNLYIKGITVNGEELTVDDATNPSSPGTWNLYGNRAIHYDMTGRQDLFFGSRSDDDTINGGDGNDNINGGAGTDTIDGGAGNDTISAGPNARGDLLYGNDGDDIVKAGKYDTGVLLDGGAGKDQLYGGLGADKITGGEGDDYLSGGGGLDIMQGGVGNDSLKGGGGAAQLYGDAGNDMLLGGTGNEYLSGGIGDDKLTGSKGNDQLSGGDGNDVFVFGPNFGHDVIAEFQSATSAQDVVQFDKTVFADFNAVQSHMAQDGSSVVITLDADNSIEIQNTVLANLAADDFRFV